MSVLYRDYRGTMSSWLLVRNGQASKVEDAMEYSCVYLAFRIYLLFVSML